MPCKLTENYWILCRLLNNSLEVEGVNGVKGAEGQ